MSTRPERRLDATTAVAPRRFGGPDGLTKHQMVVEVVWVVTEAQELERLDLPDDHVRRMQWRARHRRLLDAVHDLAASTGEDDER